MIFQVNGCNMIPGDKDKVFKSSVKQSSCQKSCFVCGKDFENIGKYFVYYSEQKCLFGGVSIMELFSFVLDQKVLSDCDTLRVCSVCSTLVSEASFALHQFTIIKNKIFLLFNTNKQPKLLSHLLPDNVSFDSLWPNTTVKDCPKLNLEDLAETRPRKKKGKSISKLKKNLKKSPCDLTEKSSVLLTKSNDETAPSSNNNKKVELSKKNKESVILTDNENVLDTCGERVIPSENDKTDIILSEKSKEEKNLMENDIIAKEAQQSEKIISLKQSKSVAEESECNEKLKPSREDATVVRELLNKEKVMPSMDSCEIIKSRCRKGGRPRKPFQCQHCHLKFYCNEVLESHCKKYHNLEFCSKNSNVKESIGNTSLVVIKNGNSLPESSQESNHSKLEVIDECISSITIEAENDADDDICRVITFPNYEEKMYSVTQSQSEFEIGSQTSDVNTQATNVDICVCFQSLGSSSSLVLERKLCTCAGNVTCENVSRVDLESNKSCQITKSSNKMRRIEPRPRAVKKIEDDGSVVYILSSIGGAKITPSLIKLSPEYVKYMSEKGGKFSKHANSSSVIQKLGKLKQKMSLEKLKWFGPVTDEVCHANQSNGAILSQAVSSIQKKKTKSAKRPARQKSSSSNFAALPTNKYAGKKQKKFRVISGKMKCKKNSSLTSDGLVESNSSPTTAAFKPAELPPAPSKDAASTMTITLARSCDICGISFPSDISWRKHCADHLLVQAPCPSIDSLDICPSSNLPVCDTRLSNDAPVVSYEETSSVLPESLSASPFPAVSISCSSLPDIKSPILDEHTPRDLSLSVLLPVLPEGISMAPLMTTPTDLRHLLAAELDDRVCDWRSKNLQNLPENPMSMDLEIGTGRLSSAAHDLSCPVINDTNLQEESMDFDRPDDSVSLDTSSGLKHPMMDVPFTPPSQNSEAIRDSEPFSHSLYHEEFSSPYNFKLVPELEPTHGYCMGEAVAAVSSPLRVDLCSEVGDVNGDDSALSTSDRMSKKLQRVSSHL